MHGTVHPLSSKTLISSKDWTFSGIVSSSSNFYPIPRVSATANANLAEDIQRHEASGVPMIIEGWQHHSAWPHDKFTLEWFQENGPQQISARNVHNWTDTKMLVGHFIDTLRSASLFRTPDETERWYGKDAECPAGWAEWLHERDVIPTCLLSERDSNLLRNQPKPVETLMCYLGIGDTSTPAHKDLCASSGQNLMCYTENDGSSYWFMTESSAAPEATTYFQKLKQELDHENHFITVEELSKAPFKVYLAEQKLGDLVLVPPRSCHQVVNYGGITIKTSWSRMTLQGLETAYYHELPIYQRVVRSETYQIKSTVFYTLVRWTQELEQSLLVSIDDAIASEEYEVTLLRVKAQRRCYADDISRLLLIFDDILTEEYAENHQQMHCLLSSPHVAPSADTVTVKPVHNESDQLTCDFCGADIFQSYFECRRCVPAAEEVSPGDGFAICAACYVEGRSCKCEVMEPIQRRPFLALIQQRTKAVNILKLYASTEGVPSSVQHAEGTFLTKTEFGIFRAACALQRVRQHYSTSNNLRSCRSGEPHQVPLPSAIYCKLCHGSRCFAHILTNYHVHSAEALWSQAQDDTLQTWHDLHHKFSKGHAVDASFVDAQRRGTRPELHSRLVCNAISFTVCKPMNTAFCKPGWYDAHAQLPLSDDNDNSSMLPRPKITIRIPPLRALESYKNIEHPADELTLTPTSDSSLSTMSTSSCQGRGPKRRRLIMEVLLPAPRRRSTGSLPVRPLSADRRVISENAASSISAHIVSGLRDSGTSGNSRTQRKLSTRTSTSSSSSEISRTSTLSTDLSSVIPIQSLERSRVQPASSPPYIPPPSPPRLSPSASINRASFPQKTDAPSSLRFNEMGLSPEDRVGSPVVNTASYRKVGNPVAKQAFIPTAPYPGQNTVWSIYDSNDDTQQRNKSSCVVHRRKLSYNERRQGRQPQAAGMTIFYAQPASAEAQSPIPDNTHVTLSSVRL